MKKNVYIYMYCAERKLTVLCTNGSIETTLFKGKQFIWYTVKVYIAVCEDCIQNIR